MIKFFEKLFYNPKWYHYFVIASLLPISFIYGVISYIKSKIIKRRDFKVKIISIGNLIVGGSGKTPFAIEIINYFEKKYQIKIFYISRGYGRVSKGLIWVKRDNEVLVDVSYSGDEAMEVAINCNCNVIVSEDRVKAIELAKQEGVDLVILDDAFGKVGIKKFDILLEPKSLFNRFVLPAGPYREFAMAKSRADMILYEGIDYIREVEIVNLKDNVLLVTAIANASRLDNYLPQEVKAKYILSDHSYFKKDKIIEKMREFNAETILVTQKDLVKLQHFNLPTSVMKLKLKIKESVIKKLEEYYEN